MEPEVPVYVAAIRIIAVLGMGIAIALGIFVLLGGYWIGLAIMAAAVPFFMAMRVMEKLIEIRETASS